MSTSQALQRLYLLDIASPNLPRYLYRLILCDKEDQYLSRLKGSEVTRLVDFLDEVRTSTLLCFIQLRSRSYRLLMSSPPPTMFSENVCINYIPSAAAV